MNDDISLILLDLATLGELLQRSSCVPMYATGIISDGIPSGPIVIIRHVGIAGTKVFAVASPESARGHAAEILEAADEAEKLAINYERKSN